MRKSVKEFFYPKGGRWYLLDQLGNKNKKEFQVISKKKEKNYRLPRLGRERERSIQI